MGKNKIAVLAIHGMGVRKENFADKIEKKLRKEVGDEKWGNVYFNSIYYQDFLQDNQDALFREMKKVEIDWISTRKFFLYSFSDAVTLERKPHKDGSPYEKAQKIIMEALNKSLSELESPDCPVFLIAHSLGCQVISNYIWDSQQSKPGQGVWKKAKKLNNKKDDFKRLKTLKKLYTTGCNIPLFIGGYSKKDIYPIETSANGYSIEWNNFYDRDDPLGWPLKPINPSYKKSVKKDIEINVGGGLFGTIFKSWNLFSHTEYWKDREFIDFVARDIVNELK